MITNIQDRDILYIGIDPEKYGGLSYIYKSKDNNIEVECYKTPSIADLRYDLLDTIFEKLTHLEYVKIYIEKIWLYPNQNTKFGHEFSTSYGIWIGLVTGVCRDLDIIYEVEQIPAKTWKKALGATSDKNLSIDLVLNIFDKYKVTDIFLKLQEGISNKNMYDMAESLLIAYYGFNIIDKNTL